MAAEVVELEMVNSPLENGTQAEETLFKQKENGKSGGGKPEELVKVNDSGLVVLYGNETAKGDENGVLDTNFPKDAAEEWPVPEQVHSFYFVKHRMYDDPVIKTKIDQDDKEIRKRNNVRFRLAGELKAKRARRADLITWLKSLRNEEKQYRAILTEKAKEIKPLHQALGKLRNANGSWGGAICSSEEELDELIESYNYRIQHETISLAEEKQLLREIKQLEGTREKVIANAAAQAQIQDSLGYKEAIQDQLKLIGSELDEIRKEQQAVDAQIKELDDELKAINGNITSLQDEMNAVTEKRDNAVERIKKLRYQNAHENSSFFECRKVISLAKNFSLTKDIKAIEDLHHAEVEKFMSQWNSSNSFRDDYEKRILPSFEIRQLSKDGRRIYSDEKPKIEEEVLTSSKPKTVAKDDAKQVNGPLKLTANENSYPSKKAQQGTNGKATTFEFNLDYDDVDEKIPEPQNPMKYLSANVEVDTEKLKELKREEEIAKAKQAMERKKRLAEKAAAKAALKAQKEAEKKNKEREKKAKKKGTSTTAAEEPDETYGQAVEEEKEEVRHEVVALVQEKIQKDPHVRHRIKQKAPEPIPKVILKRRKSSNFWVWVAAVAIVSLFILLAVLGYQSLP